MVYDHAAFLHTNTSLSLPADWDVPRFRFGEQVIAQGSQGKIVGLHWVDATSGTAQLEHAEPGWWFVIAVDSDQRRYRVEPTLFVYDSEIQKIDGSRLMHCTALAIA